MVPTNFHETRNRVLSSQFQKLKILMSKSLKD